jgi:hypothetical protein
MVRVRPRPNLGPDPLVYSQQMRETVYWIETVLAPAQQPRLHPTDVPSRVRSVAILVACPISKRYFYKYAGDADEKMFGGRL